MAELNTEVPYLEGPQTFICSEAITPSGCLVKVDAAGTVSIADAATDAIIGIAAHTTAASGERLSVIPFVGFQKVRAGAAINEGSWLTVESGGRVVATTTDTQEVIGMSASDSSDLGFVLVCCGRGRYAG